MFSCFSRSFPRSPWSALASHEFQHPVQVSDELLVGALRVVWSILGTLEVASSSAPVSQLPTPRFVSKAAKYAFGLIREKPLWNVWLKPHVWLLVSVISSTAASARVVYSTTRPSYVCSPPVRASTSASLGLAVGLLGQGLWALVLLGEIGAVVSHSRISMYAMSKIVHMLAIPALTWMNLKANAAFVSCMLLAPVQIAWIWALMSTVRFLNCRFLVGHNC